MRKEVGWIWYHSTGMQVSRIFFIKLQRDAVSLLGKYYCFQWQKQVSLSSYRPTTGRGLHRFVWKSQREWLKGRPIECYHFNPPLFSLVNTFKLVMLKVFKKIEHWRPHPVRGLKLLSEACLCHLKSLIVSKKRQSVGGVWKNPGNLQATWSFQTTFFILCRQSKYRCGLLRYLKRFYDGGRIFTAFSVSREDVQQPCFS